MRLKLAVIVTFFLLAQTILGQSDINFSVKTTNYATGKKEQGVAVKLLEGSTTVTTMTTDASGEVLLKLKPGKKYKVEVSKPGKVMRSITINVTNVDDELLQGNAKPEGLVQISLFDEVPGIDYSFVKTTPITEFYFDGQNTVLQYDPILADKMQKRIDKLLKDAELAQKQGDANYNTIIKQADALYTAKKYEEALVQYEAALKIKQSEKHPNDRYIEIDGILKAQKLANLANSQADAEYKALITAADGLYAQKKYAEAITRYQEALSKKQEQYPKDQIIEAEYAIEAEKKAAANKEKFNSLMKSAEQFYNQKSWMSARDAYKEALKIVKDDATALAKLADVEAKINGQKADQEKKQKYNDAVAAADALMNEQKWAEAKAKYTEALTFETSATYPKEKIKEADLKIDEIAKANALKEQIAKLMTEGSTAFLAKQYTVAKGKYEQVLTLDKDNSDAKAKLVDIEKVLADEKLNADKIAQAKQLDMEGDAFDKTGKFADAKAKYEASINLIPNVAIQAKIKAVEAKILAEQKKVENKEKFDQAIAEGDMAFSSDNLETAKKKYEEAIVYDPASVVPKQKLQEVEKKMAQLNADKVKEQKYAEAFNAGISALSNSDLPKAKERFQAAIAIDNTKQEAKTKLEEVEKLIADKALASAQKEKYEAAMKAGNDLLVLNKYADAKKKFEEAETIDPSQSLPKTKITEIEGLMAKADTDKQVNQLLTDGAALFAKKDLAGAKDKYTQVLGLDKGNTVASEKLQLISKMENEVANETERKAKFEKLKLEGMGFQSQNKYHEAKQKYLEAKAIQEDIEVDKAIAWCNKKIAEEEKDAELLAKYRAALEVAKKLEDAKKYNEAIAAYNEVLLIKDEQEPKNRIAAIKTILEANLEQQKVDKDYLALLAKGDDLVAQKKYTDAIQAYNSALTLKPYEKLPIEKAEIAKRLSEAETMDGDNAYKKIIDVGLKAIDEKNYTKAREMFNRAITFRPADQFPKQKLDEIDQLEKTEKQLQEQQIAFNKKIAEGDAFLSGAKYQDAINAYKAAKTIKPDSLIPDQKIEEAERLLASSKVVDPEANKKRLYDEAMAKGNAAASNKDFYGALTSYEQALKIQEKDQAAQNKISEMKQILDDIAKSEASKAELQGLLTVADEKFAAGKWSDAKFAYENVLQKFSDNKYAYDQSKLCEANLIKEKDNDIERVYRNILSGADKKFDEKKYEKAIELYERAIVQRPADPYPKNRIEEIKNILNPKLVVEPKIDNSLGEELVLENLGIEVDNSIVEGQARLQAASNEKKGRTSRKMKEKFQGVDLSTQEKTDKQTAQTQQADSLFAQIKIDNATREKASYEKAQENVDVVKSKSLELDNTRQDKNLIQELNTVNQKSQLNAAGLAVEESNSKLSTVAVDNDEVIKKTTNELGKDVLAKTDDAYAKSTSNDAKFTDARILLEKNKTDDLTERLAEEQKVKDAAIVNEEHRKEDTQKQIENSLETKTVLENSVNIIGQKQIDNHELSIINEGKILKTSEVVADQTAEKSKDHAKNTLIVDSKLANNQVVMSEMNDSRVTAASENTVKIETKREEKTEVDRKQFNDQYIKGIDNKNALVNKELEIENAKTLPSIEATVVNVQKFKEVQEMTINTSAEKQQKNDAKIVDAKTKITNAQAGISDNPSNSDKSSQNNEIIKRTNEELGTTTQQRVEKNTETSQANKKLIDEVESKQVARPNVGTYDVDLSKYPEGVSQEQFDIPGPDGTLSSIATRRIVVRGGKADVYVRTQSIDAITYQKNGAPCTEYTWQKETQDAKLKRNY